MHIFKSRLRINERTQFSTFFNFSIKILKFHVYSFATNNKLKFECFTRYCDFPCTTLSLRAGFAQHDAWSEFYTTTPLLVMLRGA